MAALSYTRQQFGNAAVLLARHPAEINTRLERAFMEHVVQAMDPGPDIPHEVAQQIEALVAELTAVGGGAAQTIAAMSPAEASEAAQSICNIAFVLERPED